MPKYNHGLDIAFTIDSDDPNGEDLTTDQILEAAQERLDYLKAHQNEVKEAALPPWDSYEIPETGGQS